MGRLSISYQCFNTRKVVSQFNIDSNGPKRQERLQEERQRRTSSANLLDFVIISHTEREGERGLGTKQVVVGDRRGKIKTPA